MATTIRTFIEKVPANGKTAVVATDSSPRKLTKLCTGTRKVMNHSRTIIADVKTVVLCIERQTVVETTYHRDAGVELRCRGLDSTVLVKLDEIDGAGVRATPTGPNCIPGSIVGQRSKSAGNVVRRCYLPCLGISSVKVGGGTITRIP